MAARSEHKRIFGVPFWLSGPARIVTIKTSCQKSLLEIFFHYPAESVTSEDVISRFDLKNKPVLKRVSAGYFLVILEAM